MKLIADFHIHSPYSRATSKEMTPANMALWAAIKGINVLGTGDILHPQWLELLKGQLIPKEGLYCLQDPTLRQACKDLGIKEPGLQRFILTGEVSCIYKQDGRLRKVHHLLLFPDFDEAERFSIRLKDFGNLVSDGRPILGLDSHTFLSLLLEEAPGAVLIPAHVWTPWFSLFGSHSGFDSVEECFKDLAHHISALETGLSSDPPMNRLVSSLDRFQLVSNSDAHSLRKIGREATIFDVTPSFEGIRAAISKGQGLISTVEFFPEEGKYHLDGHRACNKRLSPSETEKFGGICPVCGRPVTKGVLYRVMELADREAPSLKVPYHSLIPLEEILAEIYETSPSSKIVTAQYFKLIRELGPEIPLLMERPIEDIERVGPRPLGKAIQRMREGKVRLEAGYDGQYGKIHLFEPGELKALKGRRQLFFSRPPLLEKGLSNSEEPVQEKVGENKLDAAISLVPNPEQLTAIGAPISNLLIQAGPGTGKTFTLVKRIEFLLGNGVLPSEILCLTFTRRAKKELQSRISKYVHPKPYITTFHSFCLSLLRRFASLLGLDPDFVLMGEKEAKEFRDSVESAKLYVAAQQNSYDFDKLTKAIFHPKVVISENIEELALWILKSGHKDTYDYLSRYKHIFVDEYQDSNPVELAILAELLKISSGYICAIGDKNQAIYGFRGISSDNFENFSKIVGDYKTIGLKVNYRSDESIVKAANSIVGDTDLTAYNTKGNNIILKRFSSAKQEALWICEQIKTIVGGLELHEIPANSHFSNISFSDIAILYRLNEVGALIEKELIKSGIPCLRAASNRLINLYPANVIFSEIRDRFIQKVLNETGLLRWEGDVEGLIDDILHTRGISQEEHKEVVAQLRRLGHESGTDLMGFWETLLYEDLYSSREVFGERVSLMSIHASKGLEWEVVFLVGIEECILPLTLFDRPDLEEERRLFYVGVTRAKSHLFLSCCQKRQINGKLVYLNPSPFLSLLPSELVIDSELVDRRRVYRMPLFWGWDKGRKGVPRP